MNPHEALARTVRANSAPAGATVLSRIGVQKGADQFGAARPANPYSQAPKTFAATKSAAELFTNRRSPGGPPPLNRPARGQTVYASAGTANGTAKRSSIW